MWLLRRLVLTTEEAISPTFSFVPPYKTRRFLGWGSVRVIVLAGVSGFPTGCLPSYIGIGSKESVRLARKMTFGEKHVE